MTSKTVLLLKAADDSSSDPYFEKLHEAGISSTVIPTLEFIFVNDEILKNSLLCPENFSGIIFTSPRTVQAVHRIFDTTGFDISKWQKKMNYAVGEATSKLAASLLQLDLLGEEAGSSEELCKVISSSVDCDKFVEPFLFPCSQKSNDTILKILTESGLQVKKVICYKTESNSHMKENLERLIAEKGIPDIIVFFSPSGVEFSSKIINESLWKTKQPQCIAIGPTTEQAIKKANMNLCKVAKKPNPDSVLEAVKSLL
ncbi:uroporphyrinogen-III synthase-like [Argiope bruennichi]|uniref:Uroporphyrinogen-III synthase n=1 Tax=Argiope bruennichi TaxID=94029 RepID=A0A8T0FJM8_ARGBR|nr:uroporphyrinogen-III synthase-like [Argiope bruennichi]KAF8790428.1 Uroporphyrinogen-III synthase like protein [Argiope bruennichi]